jgi:hypothetical protein
MTSKGNSLDVALEIVKVYAGSGVVKSPEDITSCLELTYEKLKELEKDASTFE